MTRRSLLASLLSAVPTSGVSWLAIDMLHGTETSSWPDCSKPIGYGSLLKPFLALAFAATHSNFPILTCRGSQDGCWVSRGHGPQDVVSALAHSCNAYFLNLARSIDRAALDSVCLSYGLRTPERSLNPADLIGLGAVWQNAPLAVVRAFAQLKDQTVLRGMAQCAATGTAKKLQLSCYAKTGTAPCSHLPAAMGDGFVAAMYPTGQPRIVLLLRHHGTTGAEACRDVRERLALL